MKRSELLKIRAMIEKASASLTDDDALEAPELFPEWQTGKAYAVGDRVRYGETLYSCVQAHTSQTDWTPDATPALWRRTSVEEWPEWIQPTGAHDAYELGSKVSHNAKHWISEYDSNTWEPGVFGWSEA